MEKFFGIIHVCYAERVCTVCTLCGNYKETIRMTLKCDETTWNGAWKFIYCSLEIFGDLKENSGVGFVVVFDDGLLLCAFLVMKSIHHMIWETFTIVVFTDHIFVSQYQSISTIIKTKDGYHFNFQEISDFSKIFAHFAKTPFFGGFSSFLLFMFRLFCVLVLCVCVNFFSSNLVRFITINLINMRMV